MVYNRTHWKMVDGFIHRSFSCCKKKPLDRSFIRWLPVCWTLLTASTLFPRFPATICQQGFRQEHAVCTPNPEVPRDVHIRPLATRVPLDRRIFTIHRSSGGCKSESGLKRLWMHCSYRTLPLQHDLTSGLGMHNLFRHSYS